MTVVGGIGSIGGAILGAVYLLGVPQIFGDTTTARLATSGIGLLLILRFEHGGLIALVGPGRSPLPTMHGVAVAPDDAQAAAAAPEPPAARTRPTATPTA